MKILSDFDGVLTDQTEEAERVFSLFRKFWKDQGKRKEQEIDSWIEKGLQAISSHPHQHGWKKNGRLAAFMNEDLFIRNIALASWLDEQKELKADTNEGFSALCQTAFETMAKETHNNHSKPLDPEAAGLIKKWLKSGHDVVIVSNSTTARILNMLHAVGLDAVDHEANPKARLRVRGGAKKYELGENRRGIPIGDYFLETDRPHYEKILREEKPHVAIGDVFSMDLALPFHLANHADDFPAMKLYLRTRHYTPKWVKDQVGKLSTAKAQIGSITELTEIQI